MPTMNMVSRPVPEKRGTTYAVLEAVQAYPVAETLEGPMATDPRPSARHGGASSARGIRLGSPFQFGIDNGPGGCAFIDPRLQLLEVLALRDGLWTAIGVRNSGETVSAPPFDAISFSLADLRPLEYPLGFDENPQAFYAGDR